MEQRDAAPDHHPSIVSLRQGGRAGERERSIAMHHQLKWSVSEMVLINLKRQLRHFSEATKETIQEILYDNLSRTFQGNVWHIKHRDSKDTGEDERLAFDISSLSLSLSFFLCLSISMSLCLFFLVLSFFLRQVVPVALKA